MQNEINCQQVQAQLSAYIDDELTQQDQQRLYVHLQHCPECQGELTELLSLRSAVRSSELAGMPTLDDKVLRQLQQDRPSRWLSWIGWSLVITSGIVLGTFFIWQFIAELLADSTAPKWLMWAILAFYGGFAVLFFSVLRQRLITRKTDKYKKVQL